MDCSKLFSWCKSDWVKGLIVAILTTPITIIYDSASQGVLTVDYKKMIAAAIAGGAAYLLKNFFTGSGGQIGTNKAPMIALLLAGTLLFGCTGTQKSTAVSSYELAGITLKAGYDTAKPACDAGTIPADKCGKIKVLYNDARSAYLIAGDALVMAVDSEDVLKKQAALEDYQALSQTFTKKTTELLNLLVQAGAIKKPTTAPKGGAK